MEHLPTGYSYEVMSESSDSNCHMVRIKDVSSADGAKVCIKTIIEL